jgi:hypothetical protein
MNRPMSCPECGRQVAGQGLKLCPFCGYPLLLDRPPPVEASPHKIVHKPIDPTETAAAPRTGHLPRPGYPGPPPPGPMRYAPPPRAQPLGPHCPACRHVNPPHRKRCEVCGAELWPGAAAPARWMPDPPAVATVRPRSSWWKVALLIGIPLLLMATVWTLAFVL